MTPVHRACFAALTLLVACEPSSAPAPATPSPSAPPAGTIDLVESAPLETNLVHADVLQAHEVWVEMIQGARRSLDIAEFYISSAPQSRLEPVLAAIEAAADRGVTVRILVDTLFAKLYPEPLTRLGNHAGITLRRFDVGPVMGGVHHAKYFIVDDREAYIGSQNFDWRSLTHIQEIGVRLRDPAATAAYADVFAMDWALAAGASPPPPRPRPASLRELASGQPVTVTPVFSPERFLPDPASWELPKIVNLIDGAARSIHVQVLLYRAQNRDNTPFTTLDEALRRAAARGVKIEMLVADWSKKKGNVEAVQALARVPGVSARFLDIPPWSGGFVPFARVAHAKYMVVDGERAWVGSSNWEGDYFTRTRNAGLIVEGASFAISLERVFRDGFAGPYAEVVDPDKTYEAPKIDEKATASPPKPGPGDKP
ncbi:MAG: phospholipase D-like domain-containing protein [Byssovorax sp.]